ncbi:MAG: dienelactone hydrolase family protein [Chitinophagaceae bacterium]|jgi:carboxymethylenebutenolidase|nr:dienelactone hydrolase family protein [Chitinophagaceae bacterium]
MDKKIIQLYDEYTHKPLERSTFLKRLAVLAGSTAAAMAILPQLENNYAFAQTRDDNEEIQTERVTWNVAGGEMKGYLAKPKKPGRYPGIIVIHENRGLNPHIEDVVRRAALAGYIALGPDALSLLGGTPENADEARAMFAKLDAAQNIANFVAAVPFLMKRPECTGKVGCVGFCWGGAMANNLAVNSPDLKAAVAFYGRQAAAADVPKIKASLQLHYAGNDTRINEGIPAYEEALKAANVTYELYMYEGVDHAFHNDTSAARYNEAAAKLAWGRTMDFFKKHLA